jgi:hypothetical protein
MELKAFLGFSALIWRAAKQSSIHRRRQTGWLRRFAPRNDKSRGSHLRLPGWLMNQTVISGADQASRRQGQRGDAASADVIAVR